MTTTTLCIVGTLVLVWSSQASPASPDQFENTVTVSVYDRAHIQPKTLEQAERIATRIFAAAGVNLQWRTRLISDETVLVQDFSGTTESNCGVPLISNSVQVQIRPHAPAGFAPQALAYSLPCADHGVQVTIYADRVEDVSNQTRAVFYRVWGYTLTHELGHVLLKSLTHEKSGLMKGVWSKGDWQRAALAIIPFTPGQAAHMREHLHRIKSYNAVLLTPDARQSGF